MDRRIEPAVNKFSCVVRSALVIGLFLCIAAAGRVAVAQEGTNQADAEAASGGFWSVVLSGGVVGAFILLTLVLLSMVAVYLIVEQVMTLRKTEVMPKGLADEVRQLLAQGRLQDAGEACRKKPSPLSFVLLSGLSEIDFGWNAMEKAMEDAVAEQAAKMYRKIEYLSVIGNIAPMCGLLGTVTGMIFAFQQVAISQGTAGAADLAEGIYSALVTTVAGLIVAIPSLGAFAVLRNRVDQLIAETAYMAQHVFAPVRRRASQLPGRTPPASAVAGGKPAASNIPTPPRPRSGS
ncbi:MAG: MotA/TolQ/ExbB proton channel family protein [bacterium]|nr:MotA/TolQ/ExbB proton channel family protein [bacterium]